MLKHLEPGHTDAFERLETHFNHGQAQWEKFSVVRIIGNCVLALIMLFLLLFYKESKWTVIAASLFILLLLASMIKGWLNFSDQILLHDIRRSLRDRDQISE